MSDKQKKIVETIDKIIPILTEQEQERLLAFGEGIAFLANRRARTCATTQPTTATS